jgi:hypothetical protein
LFVQRAFENSLKVYESATVRQSSLYNGSQYVEPTRTNDEHPFFIGEDWQNGEVFYKGQRYINIPLLYDLTSDRIVSELFNGQPFALVKEHLSSFKLGDREFDWIENRDVNNSLPVNGFYEVCYRGPSKVVLRHYKVQEERIEDNSLQQHFTYRVRNYLWHGGAFVRISNKAGLLKVLKDHKQEVRSFIRSKQINFKSRDLGDEVGAVADYYDSLNPTTH